MSQTKLQILHCLRTPVGGLFRHVCDLAREQARLGYEVGVICDEKTGGESAIAAFEELQDFCTLGIVRLPMSRNIGPRDLTAYLATRRFAEAINANIIHGHGAKGGAYARLAAQSLKKQGVKLRTFYTPHGGSLHYDSKSLNGRIFFKLERKLAMMTDGFIFESDFSRRTYEEKIGMPRCECRVIPNGLLPEEFYAPQLESDAADFIFIGELRHLKGVDVLLQALADIQVDAPAKAIIVGSGPDETAFKMKAQRLGLDGNAVFPGPQPANEAFSKGRCLVVPSRAESFPYIVLEAAAAEMPMILTDVGGIPEMIEGTGISLIPPGDTEALTEKLRAFLQDPKSFIDNAKTFAERVSEQYTIDRMTDAILDFYFTKLSD